MKDSLLLRHRRRPGSTRATSCTATPTSGSSTASASTTSSSQAMAGRHGRQQERGVPRHRRERRGHLRPLPELRVCRERRGRARARAPTPCRRTDVPAAHAEDTPDTPTIETLVAHLNAALPRATDRAWAAGDTLKNVIVMLVHPDGTREPLAIGVPGDREVDEKRLGAQVEPADGGGLRREGLRAPTRRWSRATSGPARSAARAGRQSATCSTPGSSTGTRWVTGADERRPARHRPRRRAATSPPTAPSRPPRCAPATPARTAATSWSRPAASRWATSSSSARKYAEALDLKVLDQNGKLVTVDHGLLRRRRLPRRRLRRRGQPRRARPASGRARSRPADVHVVATGKDDGPVFAQGRGDRPRARGCRACTVLVRRPPGGQPRREVQGLRAHRRARRSSSSAAASPTATSRSRTARSGERREVPSTTPSPRSTAEVTAAGRALVSAVASAPVEAVIFDWGGTLTPWHTVDLPQQWRVFAREVHGLPVEDPAMPVEDLAEADSLAMRIHEAEERGLGPRARETPRERLDRGDPRRGRRRRRARPAPPGARGIPGASGSRTPTPTRRSGPLWEGLHDSGIRVGVLSNTIWTRDYHREVFAARRRARPARRATSTPREIHVVKPHPEAFLAACAAVGVEPERGGLRRRPAASRTSTGRSRSACARSRAAQRHPGEPAGGGRRDARTPWRTSCSTSSTSSTRWDGGADRGARRRRWTRHCSPSPSSPRPPSSPAGSTPSSAAAGWSSCPPCCSGSRRRRRRSCSRPTSSARSSAPRRASVTYYRRVRPDLRTALPMAAVAFVGVGRRAR